MSEGLIYWWVFVCALALGAGMLLNCLIGAVQRKAVQPADFYYLCVVGILSAVLQAILLWHISLENKNLGLTLSTYTALALLAGYIVLQCRLHDWISEETTKALLFVGYALYPAFLVVFMLWSWSLESYSASN